jgi:hypothetical protein
MTVHTGHIKHRSGLKPGDRLVRWQIAPTSADMERVRGQFKTPVRGLLTFLASR